MKIYVLGLLLLMVNTVVYSQENESGKSYLGLIVGASNPVGRYAKSEKNNDGFATAGYNLRLDWNIVAKNNVGLTGVLGYFKNGVNSEISDNDSLSLYDFESGKNKNWYFMLGPSYSIPFKNITIDVRSIAGLMYIGKYSWTVNYKKNNQNYSYTKSYYVDNDSEAGAWKFSYGFGANLRFKLSEKFEGLMGADYMTSSYKVYSSLQSSNTYDIDDKRTNVINLNWGILYNY